MKSQSGGQLAGLSVALVQPSATELPLCARTCARGKEDVEVSPTVRPVPEADTQQMILCHGVTTGGQPVTGRHLGPAESQPNKCNRIRGQPPLR